MEFSLETRKKMSLAKLGKPTGRQTTLGKHWKLSDETRAKQSIAAKRRSHLYGFKKGHKSRLGMKSSEETKRKQSEALKGRVHSIETRKKISDSHKGEKCYNYKGGTSNSVDKMIRRSLEYKLWREAVFKRDNYTCVLCGDSNYEGRGKTVIIQADHIKRFSDFHELRLVEDNGRTLCIDCHKKTSTYGRPSNLIINNLTIV